VQKPDDSSRKISGENYKILPGDYLVCKKEALEILDKSQSPKISVPLTPTSPHTDQFLKQIVYLCSKVILYADKNIIIVNKMSGLTSQGGTNVKLNLLAFLKTYLYIANHQPSKYNLPIDTTNDDAKSQDTFLVHRLDKPVSGAMMYARNAGTARFIGKKFIEKDTGDGIHKAYVGVHYGLPAGINRAIDFMEDGGVFREFDEFGDGFYGSIDTPIVFNESMRRAERAGGGSLKVCRTNFVFPVILIAKKTGNYFFEPENASFEENIAVLSKMRKNFKKKQIEIFSVSCQELIDGKKHQLRAHSSLVHHAPLLFDYKYDFAMQGSDADSTSDAGERMRVDKLGFTQRIRESVLLWPLVDQFRENLFKREQALLPVNSREQEDSKLFRNLTAKGFLGKSDEFDPKTNFATSGIMLHSYKLKFELDETEISAGKAGVESGSPKNNKAFVVYAD
jgi:23S rRNA-/tRNA-specific pseudouridylate synthase